MAIYIATTKKINEINECGYKNLIVGAIKNRKKDDEDCFYDDVGDNISEKNPYYCELTALYWMWKNTDDEYYGLAHYRRYLWTYAIKNEYVKKCVGEIKEAIPYIRTDDINAMLNEYDIVLPKKLILKETVYDFYKKNHRIADLDMTRNIIKKTFPEYLTDFDDLVSDYKMYHCNLFLMNKIIFRSYMKWLFTILFEAEKSIDIPLDDTYQRRVFGFLAERLFNVYIRHNNLKIKEVPMVFVDSSNKVSDEFDTYKYKIKSRCPKVIMRFIRNMLNE